MLLDADNDVWLRYGIIAGTMPTNEPAPLCQLFGAEGTIIWLHDCDALEHGGAMNVEPTEVVSQVKKAWRS